MSAKRRRYRLIAVWGVFGLLAAAITVLEGPSLLAPAPSERVESAQLFDFTEPELGGIQVVYERQIASLMRGPDGLWYQHDDSHSHSGVGATQAPPAADDQHLPDPTQSATIAERLARAAAMAATRQEPGDAGPQAADLARSETMIAFYGRGADGVDYSKPMEVLHIGDLQPGTNAFYAKLDGDPEITLVHQDDLSSLLEIVFGTGKVPKPTSN